MGKIRSKAMQGKSGAGPSTDGDIQLVANIKGVNGWDGRHPRSPLSNTSIK